MPKLTIIVPIYNEEGNIPELCRRIRDACDSIDGMEWSAIFVDDGSRDQSIPLLEAGARTCSNFRIVRLSRNFGHQAAISAGISLSDGDATVIMDGDLQDPPETIPDLVQCWRTGAKVVRAERLSRRDTGMRRVAFDLFHRFFNYFSDYPIPANSGVFSLLDREAVEVYNSLVERHRFFPGLSAWIGFEQASVPYHREQRFTGEPKQSWRRLFSYGMDALFGFSYVPLRMLTYTGLFISMLGFAVGLFFAMRRILGLEIAFTGFTTLVILIIFLGGIQLIALGVIGEYIARIYNESKRRPYFVVRQESDARQTSQSECVRSDGTAIGAESSSDPAIRTSG